MHIEHVRETRSVAAETLQFEERADTNELILTALAHRTGIRTTIFDYTEEISPGAFRAAIPKSNIVLNVNHGRSSGVLARTASGTMRVWENDDGLMLRARLGLEDPEAKSLAAKVRRGDLSELSFAFAVQRDGQKWTDGDDLPHRQITRVSELYDVSIVERPAYDGTGVTALRDRDSAHRARLSRDIGPALDDVQRTRLYRAKLYRRR